jgi:hypothetical protein
MKNFEVGSIVKYENGYYRVSADKGYGDKRWVNLKSVFGSKVYYKQIPASQVVEAQEEWYARWSQSETYRCM